MLAFTGIPAPVQALLVVALILVQAVVLYVGYGYVESLVGKRIIRRIESI